MYYYECAVNLLLDHKYLSILSHFSCQSSANSPARNIIMTSSQWEQILQLDLFPVIWPFYKTQDFPIVVRIRLKPDWLEFHVNQLHLNANPNNPDDVQFFNNFMTSFMMELRKSALETVENAKSMSDSYGIAMGYEFQHEIEELATRFGENSVGLFCTIKSCLDYELEMIKQKTNCASPVPSPGMNVPSPQPPTINSRYNSLDHRLQKVVLVGNSTHIGEINRVRVQMQATIAELSQLWADFNGLQVDIQVEEGSQHLNGDISTKLYALRMASDAKQKEVKEKVDSLIRDLTNFTSHIKNATDKLKEFAKELLELIEEWKVDQRHAANGFATSHSLSRISSLATTLISGVVELNRQLQCRSRIEICLPNETSVQLRQLCNEFKAELDQLLYIVVFKTFLVTQQPPQILRLKSTIKQGIKLQLLVGSTLIQNSTPIVKAMLIDKEEAEKLHDNPNYMPQPSIKLSNNELEMSNEKNKFGLNFYGITLPDKRKDPCTKGKGPRDCRDDQFVTQKKYCFYFHTTFSGPNMPSFTIWTTSIPVIVTCHPSQDADAWATILWDNAFSLQNRRPFDVPKEVNPADLIQVLSQVFKLQTRREFSESHKNMLLKKLMGNQVGKATWQMFFENRLDCSVSKRPSLENNKSKDESKVKVTFHSWLFAIKRLCEPASKDDSEIIIKEEPGVKGSATAKKDAGKKIAKDNTTIPSHWASKMIEGFISREQIHERLQSKAPGTFLLYFSEAILGGLTVAWFNHADGCVNKFAPYESKELKDHPLEERILSAEHLQFLDLNQTSIPKESAFHRVIAPQELYDFKWDLIKKGYIWHTQQQVTQPPASSRNRNMSTSSTVSRDSGSGSPFYYGSPLSVSSQSSSQSGWSRNAQLSSTDFPPDYRPTTPELYEIMECLET